MSRKVWLGVVPVVVVVALIGAGALFAKKDAPNVVAPNAGQAYFPTVVLVDEQGAVAVEVTQLNLNGPTETLDFAVAMNTHSVELDDDLTENAVLTTDTGLTVQPLGWDAPSGGHHVTGKLSFPSTVNNGEVLAKASRVTVIIRDVDAPERVFTWNLQQAG